MRSETMKALHPASVRAALRKGGHDKAVFHRSGMVRGWGEWSRGYRVMAQGDAVRVSYVSSLRFGAEREREEQVALRRYADTLVAAGFDVTTTTDYLTVTRRTEAAP